MGVAREVLGRDDYKPCVYLLDDVKVCSSGQVKLLDPKRNPDFQRSCQATVMVSRLTIDEVKRKRHLWRAIVAAGH